MSFLLRVTLPDRPGALGAVATALGTVEADIISVDVIERGSGYAVDDLVLDLPPGRLPDTLVSAAAAVEGVRVESIRPYASSLDPSRELELIDRLVARPPEELSVLADGVVRIFRAGWALVLGAPEQRTATGPALAPVLARSRAAPELESLPVPWWPIARATPLDAEQAWVSGEWERGSTELAAAPLDKDVVLIGRPAMRWLPGELARLGHLVGILATVLRRDPI
ncbi:MAG: amino acid-binding protein [Actinomycetota bacterium]|nr:amino acid-binding protein [Actinomycetota bacterium]